MFFQIPNKPEFSVKYTPNFYPFFIFIKPRGDPWFYITFILKNLPKLKDEFVQKIHRFSDKFFFLNKKFQKIKYKQK